MGTGATPALSTGDSEQQQALYQCLRKALAEECGETHFKAPGSLPPAT